MTEHGGHNWNLPLGASAEQVLLRAQAAMVDCPRPVHTALDANLEWLAYDTALLDPDVSTWRTQRAH
jgi:hypothetical protein